jgi:hypothetical protein
VRASGGRTAAMLSQGSGSVAVMKKLVLLAILAALGVIAARKIRAT